MKKLVYGFGINNAEYQVTKYENGKIIWMCPFYQRWKGMLRRAYNSKFHQKNPTYIGVTVCEEWLTFSSFREWMQSQDWKGKELDKDLLFEGNKTYSPDACVFVDIVTNQFTKDRANVRGEYLIGVYWNNVRGKFHSQCRNPFTKKREHLGLFTDELSAHKAWKRRKHQLSLQLAELQSDPRATKALKIRYSF
jgi:hypothetical protein